MAVPASHSWAGRYAAPGHLQQLRHLFGFLSRTALSLFACRRMRVAAMIGESRRPTSATASVLSRKKAGTFDSFHSMRVARGRMIALADPTPEDPRHPATDAADPVGVRLGYIMQRSLRQVASALPRLKSTPRLQRCVAHHQRGARSAELSLASSDREACRSGKASVR